MTWFRIDDGFHGHPKVVQLSLESVGLWALSGAWCAQYLTDGVVSSNTVRRLGGTTENISELVNSGLWNEHSDGWEFKDWADYQPVKAEVEAERSAARERMKRVRAAKKGVTSPDVQPNKHRTTEERSGRSSPEVRIAPPDQLPPTSSSVSKETETPSIDINGLFESAYAAWPKKVQKKKSLDKFKLHARKHDPHWLATQIIMFGKAYAAHVAKEFTPALNVWLNGERWTDDLPESSQRPGRQAPQSRAAQNIDAYWKEFGDDDPSGGMASIDS
ncbi:MAG: hypothetical protein ACTH4Y_08340 [Microbacterium gubbeenense]|uniref:hypothetical protein n=1 Tax=Microbacterium gubbeenense TaxID=159896 RepID=UPI003F9AE417